MPPVAGASRMAPHRFLPKTTAPRRQPPSRGAVVAALPRLRRRAAALVVAAATAATGAAGLIAGTAHASAADSCPPADTACFDALPADAAWKQAVGLDAAPRRYQGDGVTVATIDTGVTPTPDLGSRLLARVDLTGERDGLDRFGHGTHMAGLIAGDGSTSDEGFQGAAPEANLVSVKVAGWDGATDVSTVIAALQWVVANRERYGIRVVNLSWGTDATQGAGIDPLDLAVERAWQAGLVVVVAAGNAGPAPGTVAKPADDPYVITAGAADTARTAAHGDDTVAPFSGRGPTTDGGAKPDVLAPGVSLVSDRAPGSTIDRFHPGARLGAAQFKGSGTSQAAGVVAGVAARMVEANPALTNDQVKGVLTATADRTPAGFDGGAGLIDARAAVAAVDRDRPPGPLPTANAGLTPSTGLGTIQASRGTQLVFRDLDGDGTADPVTGEIDVLGRPWSPAAYVAAPWTRAAWAASPWAALASEVSDDSAASPPAAGALAPIVAWAPDYWGARSWDQAGWDAKYWTAKYWTAKYWTAAYWGA
jgi:serine protease AprX